MVAMEENRKFSAVCEIMNKYDYNPHKIIPILQEVQEVYRYLPEEVLIFVATALKIPPAQVFGVATFYSHFALAPKGKYVIKVCDGTACHVKGSESILLKLFEILQLSHTKNTTDDMLFTVEAVSCLGACGLAPVLVINEKVYGAMNEEKIKEVIENIIEEEESVNA
ncbi:MAG: NADH-quinone oxidoreductase subunit NuoE [Calditrichia bacterium]